MIWAVYPLPRVPWVLNRSQRMRKHTWMPSPEGKDSKTDLYHMIYVPAKPTVGPRSQLLFLGSFAEV